MKYENVPVKLKHVSNGCFVVSTGRGALLLPGKVKRFTRVLGGSLHLPRPVVSLKINLYLLEACVFYFSDPSCSTSHHPSLVVCFLAACSLMASSLMGLNQFTMGAIR